MLKVVMTMAILHLLVVVLNLSLNCYGTEGRAIFMNKTMDTMGVQASVVSNEFDCVDIYKQYALTHPALKDHKIQFKPSFLKDLKRSEDPSVKSFKHWLKNPSCRNGEVPIQKNIHYYNESFHRFTKSLPGQHLGVVRNVRNMTIHGVRGRISTNGLQLQAFQVSAGQVWVQNGPPSQLNIIQAGWEVNPVLYGDSDTHITIFWTVDNYGKTGCYNTFCPGFVLVNPKPILGDTLYHSGGGKPINVLNTLIKQDKITGNWWFVLRDDIVVGYWPKELFDYLREGASTIQYGGWTVNIPNSICPPMGSGHFASKNLDDSGFIAQMKLINAAYSEASPNFLEMGIYSDDNACYTVIYDGYDILRGSHTMYYGGPGGSCTN